MTLFDGVYDEDYHPIYVVRDESYTGPDDSYVPRFFVARVIPGGGMATGVTTYKDRDTAEGIVTVLNSFVTREVP